jgi:glutaredoxin-like protein NrdH
LRSKGIEATKVRVDQDPEALEFIKGMGYSAAPVVVVTDGDEVVDSWSGFSETKLEALRDRVAA